MFNKNCTTLSRFKNAVKRMPSVICHGRLLGVLIVGRREAQKKNLDLRVRHSCLWLFSLSIAVLSTSAPVILGQQVKHPYPSTFKRLEPVHHSNIAKANMAVIRAQASAGSTIPLWNYSIVAGQDGNTYQGSIVGRSPYYHGYRSTTVQAYLVPVIFTFPDGAVYDPTAFDGCEGDSVVNLVQNSPVFQSADFTFTDTNGNNPVDVGTTQYGDATQRANYWNYVAPSPTLIMPYHTLLGLNNLPPVSVTVPAGFGFTQPSSCGYYGVMDYNWWDNYVTNTLIPSLSGEGVGPTNVPIFVFDSVVMYLNGDVTQCCALGDHGGYLNTSNLLQTYIVANFDTTGAWRPDISVLSDELAKWINDPAVSNPTPAWSSSIGDMAGQCENILEVGDPVTGYLYPVPMPNGFTYNPQELAYFSWFYNQAPSIGAGGWYSDQGTLTSDAGSVCQGSITGVF